MDSKMATSYLRMKPSAQTKLPVRKAPGNQLACGWSGGGMRRAQSHQNLCFTESPVVKPAKSQFKLQPIREHTNQPNIYSLLQEKNSLMDLNKLLLKQNENLKSKQLDFGDEFRDLRDQNELLEFKNLELRELLKNSLQNQTNSLKNYAPKLVGNNSISDRAKMVDKEVTANLPSAAILTSTAQTETETFEDETKVTAVQRENAKLRDLLAAKITQLTETDELLTAENDKSFPPFLKEFLANKELEFSLKTEALKFDYEDRITSLERQVEKLLMEKVSIEHSREAAIEENSSLKQRIDCQRAESEVDIEMLEAEVSQLRDHCATLKDNLKSSDCKLRTLENEVEEKLLEKDKRIQNGRKEFAKLTDEATACKLNLTEIYDRIVVDGRNGCVNVGFRSRLTGTQEVLDGFYCAVQAKNEARMHLDKFQKQARILQAKNEGLEQSLVETEAAASAQINKLEAELIDAKRQLQKLDQNLSLNSETVGKIIDLEARNNAYLEQIKEMANSEQKLRSKIDMLTASEGALKETLSNADFLINERETELAEVIKSLRDQLNTQTRNNNFSTRVNKKNLKNKSNFNLNQLQRSMSLKDISNLTLSNGNLSLIEGGGELTENCNVEELQARLRHLESELILKNIECNKDFIQQVMTTSNIANNNNAGYTSELTNDLEGSNLGGEMASSGYLTDSNPNSITKDNSDQLHTENINLKNEIERLRSSLDEAQDKLSHKARMCEATMMKNREYENKIKNLTKQVEHIGFSDHSNAILQEKIDMLEIDNQRRRDNEKKLAIDNLHFNRKVEALKERLAAMQHLKNDYKKLLIKYEDSEDKRKVATTQLTATKLQYLKFIQQNEKKDTHRQQEMGNGRYSTSRTAQNKYATLSRLGTPKPSMLNLTRSYSQNKFAASTDLVSRMSYSSMNISAYESDLESLSPIDSDESYTFQSAHHQPPNRPYSSLSSSFCSSDSGNETLPKIQNGGAHKPPPLPSIASARKKYCSMINLNQNSLLKSKLPRFVDGRRNSISSKNEFVRRASLSLPRPNSTDCVQIAKNVICSSQAPGPTCSGPSGFRVIKRVGANSLLVTWAPSTSNSQIIGYELFVNGVVNQQIKNTKRTKCLLTNCTPAKSFSSLVEVSIQAVSENATVKSVPISIQYDINANNGENQYHSI